jgi:hypothetical protein
VTYADDSDVKRFGYQHSYDNTNSGISQERIAFMDTRKNFHKLCDMVITASRNINFESEDIKISIRIDRHGLEFTAMKLVNGKYESHTTLQLWFREGIIQHEIVFLKGELISSYVSEDEWLEAIRGCIPIDNTLRRASA